MKIFIPISVEDELPTIKDTNYPVKFKSNNYYSTAYFNGKRFEVNEHCTVTHWLKEVELDIPTDEEIWSDAINKYPVEMVICDPFGGTDDCNSNNRKIFIEGFKAAKSKQPFQSRVVNVSDEEIKQWIKSHGYYGSCTTEYYEGLEEGVEWMRSKLSLQSEKEMDEFAEKFLEWIQRKEWHYSKSGKDKYSWSSHITIRHGKIPERITTQQLLTNYKESITVKK